jgi:hypothetical protein
MKLESSETKLMSAIKEKRVHFISHKSVASTGLPDFSWSKISKWGKNIPNNHKIYQMAKKYFQWP